MRKFRLILKAQEIDKVVEMPDYATTFDISRIAFRELLRGLRWDWKEIQPRVKGGDKD